MELAERLIACGRAPGWLPGPLAGRIRKLRSWGILDVAPRHNGLGQGGGSRTAGYPPEAESVVIGMLDAFSCTRLRHRAVRVAWWRGTNVGDKALRQALEEGYRELQRNLDQRPRNPGGTEGLTGTPAERKILLDAMRSTFAGHQITPEQMLLIAKLMTVTVGNVVVDAPSELARALAAVLPARNEVERLEHVVELEKVAETSSPLVDVPLVATDLSGRPVPSDLLRSIMRMTDLSLAREAAASAERPDLDRARGCCHWLFEHLAVDKLFSVDVGPLTGTIDGDLALFAPVFALPLDLDEPRP